MCRLIRAIETALYSFKSLFYSSLGYMLEKSPWHDELVEMLGNPFENETLKGFAEKHDITTMTIWRYRKNHPELDAEVKMRLEKTLDHLKPFAYRGLAAKLQKDTNALKLYFQLCGDLVERTEVTQHLSIEQKRQLAQDLMNKLSDTLISSKDALQATSQVSKPLEPSKDAKTQ